MIKYEEIYFFQQCCGAENPNYGAGSSSGSTTSVADPTMFIPNPDFYTSRIRDTTTAKKEEGEKLVVLPFNVATNITKLKVILLSQFTKNYSTIYPK